MGSGKVSTMRNFIVLYLSPNIVRVIKSIRSNWVGHVARMEESSRAYKILTGKPTGNRLDIDGRTILEWDFKKYVSIRGIGLIRCRIGISGYPL